MDDIQNPVIITEDSVERDQNGGEKNNTKAPKPVEHHFHFLNVPIVSIPDATCYHEQPVSHQHQHGQVVKRDE